MAWTGVAGKRVVITGATNGIGLAAAQALGRRGARLTIVARSRTRGEAAARSIGSDVDVILADLTALGSVRALADDIMQRYPKVEVLVNNAGAVNSRREMTADGFEKTWALNHLAPFLLTTRLLDRLRASAPARVITTSSDAHHGARSIPFDDLAGDRTYGPMGFGRYSQSKLANILFTRELARRLVGTGVEAYAFHPGFVASGFNRNNGVLMGVGMALVSPFARNTAKGAETLVWLADSPEADGQSGGYFYDRRRVTPTAAAQDDAAARRLWEISEQQVAAVARR